MKFYKMLFYFLFSTLLVFLLPAEVLEPGDWYQTSSTAGDAPDIIMSVIEITPHIVQLDSNNGWVGYAWYSETEDEYNGFFELLKDTGEKMEGWTNKIFRIRLVLDKKTLSLEGMNEMDEFFLATCRLKKKL